MMKTNLMRVMMLLTLLALSVGSVFAQEEAAATVNSFTFVLVIIGGGIGIVALLGMAMRDSNNNGDTKSD